MDKYEEKILIELRGKGCLYHATSRDSFRQIITDGAIKPNLGNFKPSYSQSENSLARHYKSISLFDFDSRSVEEISWNSSNWSSFLLGPIPQILIVIEKTYLDPLFLLESWNLPNPDSRTWIPYVEVLYSREISIDTFLGFFIFDSHKLASLLDFHKDSASILNH